MELLLIRHGRPVAERADAGADPGLTDSGRAEAELLGRWLAATDRAPDALWTSPMRRARETADEILGHVPVPCHVDGRLEEFDAGAGEYRPADDLDTDAPADRAAQWRVLETGVWGAHRFDPDAFERRVAGAFDDIVDAHPSSLVAVVCHGGVLNSWLGHVIGRPRGMFFRPDHTSISRVTASRHGRRLLSLNETPHLQLDRMPTGRTP